MVFRCLLYNMSKEQGRKANTITVSCQWASHGPMPFYLNRKIQD